MFKKICFVLWSFLVISTANAAGGANIFAYPREAPQTPIYNQYGQAFALKDFAGDFVVAVFWSKTCIPCLREMDDLNEFVKKTAENGIKVVLISPAEDWLSEGEQRAFLRRYGATDIDFYVDKKAKLATDFGVFTSPHAVLINEESMEIGRIRGSVDWDDEDVIEYIYKIKAQH